MYDPINLKYATIPTNIVGTPTASQIISCLNSRGESAYACARAVYNNNLNVTAQFDNLLFESQYNIYYVVANEYPVYPEVSSTVYSAFVNMPAPLPTASTNAARIYAAVLGVFLYLVLVV